jgi:hypothetical protein
MDQYLKDLRDESIWFHSKYKGLNGSQIAIIFNIPRSTVHDIIKKMPEFWTSSWSRIK